ncbi:acyl-CoA dehydrogenase family protein [Hoeflea alexandrii]|uniref:acyl-CoA dehydrogenase family protein n=1 Tax=Hoeflea alexandrii TaxID=288436 RepID=UPI0022AF6B7B|nr:acyl-CoA dehydrogenase family protein [Hoeflea alexandrii]MCZ4291689.1 acyl-CoA dehydrogenase family protein [Hoeflea alexandrii]
MNSIPVPTKTALPLLFEPDDTLEMLADMLSRALAGQSGGHWREELWPMLAELGLFAAVMPERYGGYGGARTAALVCRLLAGSGVVSPYAVSSAAIAPSLAELDQPAGRVTALLEALVEGRQVATIALHEVDALPVLRDFQTVLSGAGEGQWRLDGAKRMIAFAQEADWLVLPARNEAGHLVIIMLDRASFSPLLQPCTLIDSMPAADASFSGLVIDEDAIVAVGEQAESLLRGIVDRLTAAQCAEAVGAMAYMINATAEYLGVRRQFGQPLSAHQALRHRYVDMTIQQAKAETMAALAATAVDQESPEQRDRALARARYVIVRAAWFVSQESIQMHGAIGMANETPVSGYFKRLLALSLWLGDEDDALEGLIA